jgi:hypothetical protein
MVRVASVQRKRTPAKNNRLCGSMPSEGIPIGRTNFITKPATKLSTPTTKTRCLQACIKQPLGLPSVVAFQNVARIRRGCQKTKQNEKSVVVPFDFHRA